MVKAVLPTPPSPNTTNLYSVIFPAILFSSLAARRSASLFSGTITLQRVDPPKQILNKSLLAVSCVEWKVDVRVD